MLLTPEKEKKSKGKTRQKCGDVSVLPHGGRQCSGLMRSSSDASLASKRADSTSKRLTKLGTTGGGPARPLRRSSLEDGVTASSAVVRERESNPYFCGIEAVQLLTDSFGLILVC
ncbi:hypothetical protein PIB30_005946 [Stylosanthes scabra]|uniref:Uncharacterized protein n=1 Tax=Stylosanthes scabra TaxID=79078 RepID=A0ABU6S3X0_9FABA|nr:hypothetical protein [Stylosanthes scabra]